MANELKLDVKVTGAQQGAQQLNQVAAATDKTAAAASKSVGATKGAADATKSLGEALSGLGSRNNDAKDVLEGVSAAAKGGEGALFGLAKAGRAAFAVFASGPIGIAVAGLALLGTAALALSDKLGSPKKSAEELAKELEAAKKRAEDLGQSRLQQLTSDLASIKTRASEATQALDDMLAAQKRIADQEKSTALAKNRNDTTITEAERTKREFAINDRFATSDDQRSLQALEGRERIAAQRLASEVQVNAPNESEYRAALAERNELKARISRLEQLREQLGNELQGKTLYEQDKGKIDSIRAEARTLGDPQRELAVNDRRFSTAQDNAQKGREAIFEAEKALAAATKKLAAERETQGKVAKLREEEIAVTQKAAVKEATKTDIEKAQQRKTTTEEQQKLAREIDAAQAGGDFGKQTELAREYERRQKLIDLEGAGPKAEKTPFTPQKFSTFAPSQKSTATDQAAQEIKDAKPVDPQPAADAVKEVATALQSKNAEGNANVQAAATIIRESAAAIPAPVDIAPVAEGFAQYHGVVVQKFGETDQKLADFGRQIQLFKQQLQSQQASR